MISLFILSALLSFATASLHPEPTSGLPRSTPERQGISSTAILDFVERADREIESLHSLMVVRHGAVVAEAWWSPYDAESPHVLYSLSKSFTSTAVGLAVAQGKLSLHDPVLSFFPDDAPSDPSANLKAMRVHDLLRMSTGHQTEMTPRPDESWVKTFLAHPVPFTPGTHFLYNTPATYMLSAIVQKVTGETVLDYLRPRLFEPLGIENPIWGTSPQGITLGGYGLSIRTEDIAKFGQLYLQKGMWNGVRLLPEAWVEAATSLQTSNGGSPDTDWHQGYGYQFWRSRHNTYRGDGAFGQYCLVFPDQDAVIAITSGVRDMQAVMNLVWEVLLPAMGDGALAEDPTAHTALTSRLIRLTIHPPDGEETSPAAQRVSRKTYAFPENDRGIETMAFDFMARSPILTVQTQRGVDRVAVGRGVWATGSSNFANGLGGVLGIPATQAVGASGAWTAQDTFTLLLCLYETPFITTMHFRFDGEGLIVDSEHNVAFGPAAVPRLVGYAQ